MRKRVKTKKNREQHQRDYKITKIMLSDVHLDHFWGQTDTKKLVIISAAAIYTPPYKFKKKKKEGESSSSWSHPCSPAN